MSALTSAALSTLGSAEQDDAGVHSTMLPMQWPASVACICRNRRLVTYHAHVRFQSRQLCESA